MAPLNCCVCSAMALQENIRTVPNLLSLARIVAAPGLCLLVVHCHYTAALAIFVLAGISDVVCVRMCTCVGRGEGKVTLTHPLPFARRTATLPAHSLSRPLPLALCWTPWQTSSWPACSFWRSPPLATCHVRLAYCPPPPCTAPPSLPPGICSATHRCGSGPGHPPGFGGILPPLHHSASPGGCLWACLSC